MEVMGMEMIGTILRHLHQDLMEAELLPPGLEEHLQVILVLHLLLHQEPRGREEVMEVIQEAGACHLLPGEQEPLLPLLEVQVQFLLLQ